MPITSVHYQKLVNLGNYENERVGAYVTLAEGQTPEEAIAEARAFVDAQVGRLSEEEDRLTSLQHQRYDVEATVRRLDNRLRDLKEEWRRVAPILAAHGIVVGADPFPPDEPKPSISEAVAGSEDAVDFDDDQDEDQDDDGNEERAI